MAVFIINENKISLMRTCLEIGQEKFLANAKTLREIPGHERLAEQFDRQAAEAGELLAEIDH